MSPVDACPRKDSYEKEVVDRRIPLAESPAVAFSSRGVSCGNVALATFPRKTPRSVVDGGRKDQSTFSYGVIILTPEGRLLRASFCLPVSWLFAILLSSRV